MNLTDTDTRFLREAIRLASESVAEGGGPFGAVIVLGGEVLARAANRVTPDHDPTAHAEVRAIRLACDRLASHDLTGATLYASCEPCPMCLGAIYWARISRLVYAASKDDAARAGFDDAFIYRELALDPAGRSLPSARLLADEGHEPFERWMEKTDRCEY